MQSKLIKFPDELIELIAASQNSKIAEPFTAAVRRLILAGLEAEKAKEKK